MVLASVQGGCVSQFEVGDKVTWSSQSGGSHKRKEGIVVDVIPAKSYPNFVRLNDKHNSRDVYGGGSHRDHESYVILVPHSGNGKGVLYWPRVSALEIITKERIS